MRNAAPGTARHDAPTREDVLRAMAHLAMARREEGRGSIRQHRDGRLYVDFGPGHRVWYFPLQDRTIRLTRELAQEVLRHVRIELGRGVELDAILAEFQPKFARANLISARIDRWLEGKRRETAAGDLSPTYLRELERWCRAGGHLSWWRERSILDVDVAALEDFAHELADRGLAPKTRWNVLGAFHAFLVWSFERGEIRSLPRRYPWPRLDEHSPTIISPETQDAILQEIPAPQRGIFLALAFCGMRPGEAVALRCGDYAPGTGDQCGWITISKARKGRTLGAPIRGTKTRRVRRVPVPEDLATWIEAHVPARRRLEGGMLFVTPYAGRGRRPAGPWTPTTLRRVWLSACEAVGVSVGLYEGTKHAAATDALRRGRSEREVQALLGHADPRSTRRYARLADDALVDVIRRPRPKA